MTEVRIRVGLAAAAVTVCLGVGSALAQDDGEAVFKRYCTVCHTVEAGKNKIGPSLAGIIGRKAGSAPAFSYSDANKNSGVVWDEAKLDEYLTDPRKFIPNTKMIFIGLKKPEERTAVINYLKQH